MPEADQPDTIEPTRRRALLMMSAPAFAAAAPAGAAPACDRELIALGREMEARWIQERAVLAQWKGRGTHESDEITEAAADHTAEIVDRIHDTTARTLAGLKVKARAVAWCFAGEALPTCDDGPTSDWLAYGLIRDVLGMETCS